VINDLDYKVSQKKRSFNYLFNVYNYYSYHIQNKKTNKFHHEIKAKCFIFFESKQKQG